MKRIPNSYHLCTIHEIDFKGDDSLVKVEGRRQINIRSTWRKESTTCCTSASPGSRSVSGGLGCFSRLHTRLYSSSAGSRANSREYFLWKIQLGQSPLLTKFNHKQVIKSWFFSSCNRLFVFHRYLWFIFLSTISNVKLTDICDLYFNQQYPMSVCHWWLCNWKCFVWKQINTRVCLIWEQATTSIICCKVIPKVIFSGSASLRTGLKWVQFRWSI